MQQYIKTSHVFKRAKGDIDKSKDTSQVRKTVVRRGEAISRRANGVWLKLAFPAGFFRVLQARRRMRHSFRLSETNLRGGG